MARPKSTTNSTVTKTVKAKVDSPAPVAVAEEVKPVNVIEVTEKVKKKHDPEELITCRSITAGELVYLAKKTGILYTWADYGDEIEVQYQDLLPLSLTHSALLFDPKLIIENEELVAEWDKIGNVYKGLFKYDDIEAVLSLDDEAFRNALLVMPAGLKDSLKNIVATKIDEGQFDSLNKIKIIDQVLGTDLYCLTV